MRTIKLRNPRIDAALAAETANSEDRTVEVTFYSGATVERFSWVRGEYLLKFSMEPEHVRMERLNSGTAPVLETHSDWSTRDVLGVIESGSIEGGKGKARMRFAKGDPEADQVWNKIEQKILHNVSMGVRIHRLKEISKEEDKIKSYLAIDWEPLEVSVVPIGADPGAHIHMADGQGPEQEIEVLEAEPAQSALDLADPDPNAAKAQTAAVETARRQREIEILKLQ